MQNANEKLQQTMLGNVLSESQLESPMSRRIRGGLLSLRIHQALVKRILKWVVLTGILTYILTARTKPQHFSSSILDLPSSLTADPTLALVAPGTCQFAKKFTSVPLLKQWKISSTSCVLRFGLPDTSAPLNLSTCACILAKAGVPDLRSNSTIPGKIEQVIRPYTPISTNAQIGSFDVLVKDYGKTDGRLSHHLCNLQKGEEISFSHTAFNVKIQAPFPSKTIGMIVGGTGIAPMIQAAHAILGDSEKDDTEIIMLYGSKVSSDILGKDLLDSWSAMYGDRLTVIHVLSQEKEDSEWNGATGYINAAIIEKYFPPPDDNDMMIFICGPPPMYEAFSGPRHEKELSGTLQRMGYSAEQVYKF